MTFWTDEQTEQLRTLLAEGKSAGQAATAIGGGMSRNAVISKAHRSGMQMNDPMNGGWTAARKREAGEERQRKAERRRARSRLGHLSLGPSRPPRPQQPKPALAQPPEVRPPLELTVLELNDNDCHFITTNERPYFYCGHPALAGVAYCPGHARVVYQPLKPRAL